MSLPLPDQGVAVDQVGTGARHAEGGGEGLGAAAEDLVLAGDDGHGAVRVIAEDHLHVAAGQVGQIAVAGDEVDAAFQLAEGTTQLGPKPSAAVGVDLVIPACVEAALGGGAAGVVVPQVQAVVGEGASDPAGLLVWVSTRAITA